MSAPNGSTNRTFIVVCASHGKVQDGIADAIAADLIAKEHRENCDAKSDFMPEPEFQKASDIFDDVDYALEDGDKQKQLKTGGGS